MKQSIFPFVIILFFIFFGCIGEDEEEPEYETPYFIRFTFWKESSVPVIPATNQSFSLRNRAKIFWYNPYTQVRRQDVWPESQTSTIAQSELIDILVLHMNVRTEQWEKDVSKDSIWAGISLALDSDDFYQVDTNSLEIWLIAEKGNISIDLGSISEDWNGNRIFDTEDKPEAGLLIGNTFLEDHEDIGLDGCEDEYEDGYGGCLEGITYAEALLDSSYYDLIYIGEDRDESDPNGDNWEFNETGSEGHSKYRYINGTEGNGTANRPLEGARYPDTEDINRDGNFDRENDYFIKILDLSEDSEDWQNYQGDYNETKMGKWRLYRIPLTDFTRVKPDGVITWDTIKFMRLTLSGIPDSATIMIASIEFVEND